MKHDLPRVTILTTSDIAARTGWPTQRARRWLKKYGAVELGPTGRYTTTPAMLANDAPQFWEQLSVWGGERKL